MERAGTFEGMGSITGLYTVLVEGDDMNEPIADAVRGILDGHVVLSRRLATKNHFPAIDVLASISRLFSALAISEQKQLVSKIRDLMATYNDAEDLIQIGAYVRGSSPNIDQAIHFQPAIQAFLRQAVLSLLQDQATIRSMLQQTLAHNDGDQLAGTLDNLRALLLTGARREELAALRWDEVDFKWGSLWVKDKVAEEGRKIPLTPYFASLLQSLPRRNEWVFSSPTAENGRIAEPRIPHNRALSVAGLDHVTLQRPAAECRHQQGRIEQTARHECPQCASTGHTC
jgi:hypothetical protein